MNEILKEHDDLIAIKYYLTTFELCKKYRKN